MKTGPLRQPSPEESLAAFDQEWDWVRAVVRRRCWYVLLIIIGLLVAGEMHYLGWINLEPISDGFPLLFLVLALLQLWLSKCPACGSTFWNSRMPTRQRCPHCGVRWN